MATKQASTRSEFSAAVLENSKLVLVDFWAEWCPPCRAMAPILESVSGKLADSVDIVKVDIESHPDAQALAAEYGVQGIPNMQLFQGGTVIDQYIGMMPEVALIEQLDHT